MVEIDALSDQWSLGAPFLPADLACTNLLPIFSKLVIGVIYCYYSFTNIYKISRYI